MTTLVDHPHLELMIILETGDRWWAQGSSLGLTSKDPFCDTSSTKNQIQTSMFGQKINEYKIQVQPLSKSIGEVLEATVTDTDHSRETSGLDSVQGSVHYCA